MDIGIECAVSLVALGVLTVLAAVVTMSLRLPALEGTKRITGLYANI
jgi:hypothetical protein